MSFAEVTLFSGVVDLGDGVGSGAVGGPTYVTEVVTHGSGDEQRNRRWANGRLAWELGQRRVTRSELDTLIAFFRARGGRHQGFRLRDWSDYQATDEALSPDGTPTVQLVRTYSDAGNTETRNIVKPSAGVTMTRNGSSYAGFSVDTTTGIATLTALQTSAITNTTAANPVRVNDGGHPWTTGDVVYITGVAFMTEINDRAFTVTVIDGNNYSLDGEDGTGYSAGTGGSAAQYVQPSDTLTWSGTYDVPVRFDTDQLRHRFDAWRESDGEALFQLFGLPVIEVRV